jgi:signal transduction histidine kinase/ligand-binding sensor domain-containing protein/CheY-like chemotaxis protein/AraC-like DNA-binding protein
MRVQGDSLVPVRLDLLGDTVAHVLRRRDGTLSIGTTARGLVRLRIGADGSAERLAAPQDSAMARQRITSQLETRDGRLWVATDSGIWFDRDGWKRVPMAGGPEMHAVLSMQADPRGSGVLLYGLRAPGIFARGIFARADDQRITVLDSGPPEYKGTTLWTSANGWWHARRSTLKRNGLPVLTLGPEPANGDAFVSDALGIITGLADSEGSVWLGTFAGGLHRIKPTMVRTVSEPEGLASRNVYGVYADRLGGVWVGSLGRGFSRIDAATGRVEGSGQRYLDGMSVRVFLEGSDGTFWVGGESGRAVLNRCARVPRLQCTPERLDVSIIEVYALHEDPDQRLWIGALNGLFRRENGRVVRVDSTNGAPAHPVRAFARTRDGALWMGTNGGGLVRYREGSFRTIDTADGLPSNLVRALHLDSAGMLWVGTEGRGLARLDPAAWSGSAPASTDARVGRLSQRQGLYDESIHEILSDGYGRLWMSSNRGLFWIDRNEASAVIDGRATSLRSTSYTERDGMRNREGNGGFHPSGVRTSDGRLWFATQDGVAIIDPAAIAPDTVAPPIVIEQVIAGDSALLLADSVVRLSPAQRDIRIDFTALTFLEPRNVRFRYRLEGYNESWVDNDTRRSAFFTKLPPGTYTFRVQASKPGQSWRESPVGLTVIVEPRLVETWWFRMAGIGTLVFLAGQAARRRTRDARRRSRELEQLVSERTLTLRDREQQLERQYQQLESQAAALRQLDTAKSRFFANVSHELRTPLTLMVAPLDRLRDHHAGSEHDRWLDLAQRNAKRLLELVNQLLDVAKLEAGAMRLAPRLFDVSALLQGALDGFRLAAERKQLQLVADVPLECQVTLDSDAVEKIVANLLSNAVKFTPPGGVINVELRRDATGISLAVANTGPAIPPAQLALMFERFYQVDESQTAVQPGTGIGLSLVKELVELLDGTIAVHSDDLSTTFTVQIPVRDTYQDPLTIAAARTVSGPILLTAAARRDERELDVPTLLVVDDNQDMRRFVRAHFDGRFRVLEAGDGEEALTLARSQLPDVIISDVMMPRMDGRELVRRLRKSPDTDFLSVLLLTAQADNEQRITGLEGGADDYLGKPFEMRELMARVGNLIAARRRLQLRYGQAANGSVDTATATGAPVVDGAPAASLPASPFASNDGLSDEDRAYRDKLMAAIHARLGNEEFGVGELADVMAQDRSHLFRRVRHVTGQAPSDLLRRLRVEEGARLLRTTAGSVADVAFSVGFRSVSHFFRCFQERYGVTPGEYRASSIVSTT